MLKHISFDVDGTLYYETPEFKHYKNEVMAELVARKKEMEFSDELVDHYQRKFEKVKSHTQVLRSFRVFSQSHTTLEKIDVSLFLSKDPLLCQTLTGILNDGISISWYSNNSRKGVYKILGALGIDPDCFLFGISGEEIPKSCENNRGYVEIVRRIEAEGHEQDILYVGDRDRQDILPAQSAGLTTALVKWDSSMEAPFRNPHLEKYSNREFDIRDIYAVRDLADHLRNLE